MEHHKDLDDLVIIGLNDMVNIWFKGFYVFQLGLSVVVRFFRKIIIKKLLSIEYMQKD